MSDSDRYGYEQEGLRASKQPGLVYALTAQGKKEYKKLYRGGDDRGKAYTVSSVRSSPDTELPRTDMPGGDGLQQDDCGDDWPAFCCNECGSPTYVGRTCSSPHCERCWASAVKQNVVSKASKLYGFRKKLRAMYNYNQHCDFNHVVASVPSGFAVDSDEPVERSYLLLKTLLEQNWSIEGFQAIYHPYRIEQQHRKDQYEHGGQTGEGNKTWKDIIQIARKRSWDYVIDEYLYYSPHFHLFFPHIRKGFDYMTAESVEEQSSWVFHRITKGEDSNVSVKNYEDLIHQMTYCYSHAAVSDDGFVSRMKGKLYNSYAPEGAEDEALAAFCDAAPKLLGVTFSNIKSESCSEEVEVEEKTTVNATKVTEDRPSSDSTELRENSWDVSSDNGFRDKTESEWSDSDSVSITTTTTTTTEGCGGTLVSIHRASELLEDDEWVEQAEHSDELRKAVEERRRRQDNRDSESVPPPDEYELDV